jgi:hypothetical protein
MVMFRKSIAVIVILALGSSGCASAGTTRLAPTRLASQDVRNEMIDYVQRLPVGSRVRVDRVTGRTLHGTLMAADSDAVVVQRATRIPEAPMSIPLRDIARIQIEERSNLAKAIIIGAAAGAGATLGVLFLIAAALGD